MGELRRRLGNTGSHGQTSEEARAHKGTAKWHEIQRAKASAGSPESPKATSPSKADSNSKDSETSGSKEHSNSKDSDSNTNSGKSDKESSCDQWDAIDAFEENFGYSG